MSLEKKIIFIDQKELVNTQNVQSIVPSIRKFVDLETPPTGKHENEKEEEDYLFNLKPGTIPLVLNDHGKNLLQQLKLAKNKYKRQKVSQSKIKIHNTETNDNEEPDKEVIDKINDSYEIQYYLELPKYLRNLETDLNQQILSLTILKFPQYSNLIIDKFLKIFLKTQIFEPFLKNQKGLKLNFHWTCSNYENSDSKIIYLNLIYDNFLNENEKESKIEFLKKVFLKIVTILNGLKLSNTIKDEYNRIKALQYELFVTYENNTKRFLKEYLGDVDEGYEDLKALQNEVVDLFDKLLKDSPNEEKNINKTSELKSTYKVNYHELQDLPKEIIPQVVEDIKDFRLGIIKLEKQKQAKKLIEEKKRAKIQIKRMYQAINQAKGNDYNDSDYEEEDEEEEDDDDEEEDEINDSDYEKIKEDEEQTKIEKEFLIKQSELIFIENQMQKKLIEKFNDLKNHKENIAKLKPIILEDYDTLFGSDGNLTDIINSKKINIESLKKIILDYENNKSNYLKERSLRKIKEVKKDIEDEELEAKEMKTVKESVDFLESVLGEESKPEIEFKESIDKVYEKCGKNLSKIIEKITPFINELLIEYLGMSEDELLKFLKNSLNKKDSKESIHEEISNFLDDDADIFMKKLWNKLEEESIL